MQHGFYLGIVQLFPFCQLAEVVRTVFMIALYIGIMLAMDWRLALIAVAFLPVTGLASGVFYGKISARFQAADEAEGEQIGRASCRDRV